MGMAASQARYLALVARKSNCEYEGQQINQARTVLSNQSANLFNQMLGLTVPTPPSTSDYTTTQYSYSDGLNSSTISSWQQLANDPDYNYVVTHYYTADKYTGSMKKLSDPQVQFPSENAASETTIKEKEQAVQAAYQAYVDATTLRDNVKTINSNLETAQANKAKLSSYATTLSGVTSCSYSDDNKTYTITTSNGETEYTQYNDALENNELLRALTEAGAISDADYNNLYFNLDNDGNIVSFATQSDLQLLATSCALSGASANESINIYTSDNITSTLKNFDDTINNCEASLAAINPENLTEDQLDAACDSAYAAYEQAMKDYENAGHPTYIGNSPLTALAELSSDQDAEIKQIVSDMKDQDINANILNCFDEDGNYTGGIYSFSLNGTTYYTTYEDLYESYNSGTGNNHIDGQAKLAYYNASYVSTKIEETEKALVETDGNGRFSSIRFENDSVKYTLNMETVTDEAAYNDAMNQYYYDNAVYDKTVQDINAKTSLIQQEDLQLELRLKQLDTEQNALSTEIDAVQKVVKDNVESSFKTFGG